MKITSTNSINFNAKLYPYPKTISNPKVFEMFEERTKNFPKLILKQDDISYYKNDYFQLLHQDKQNIISHGYFSYTHNRPKTLEQVIDRLVNIFETLREKPLPEMHVD